MISIKTDELSMMCLEEAEKYHRYTDKDLENATLIFMHFFMDKMYEKNVGKMSQKQMVQLAEEAGKGLRKMILKYTGKDMHEIVKK